MAVLILAFIVSLAAVSAASTPVSVHNGEDATFSWPLPASARGQLVKVVSPHGKTVLDWPPDCDVTPSSFYIPRIRSSCKDASRVTFTLLGVAWPDEGSYTCRVMSSSDARIEDCGQNLTLVKVPPKMHIELSTPDTVAMETEGKYLILTCVVTEAFPLVLKDGYNWSYLPSPLGQQQSLVEKTNTLTLGPLTRNNSGQYFCQAWNDPDNEWNILPVTTSFALNTSCIDALLHSDFSPRAVVEKDRNGYKAMFQLPQHPGLIQIHHPNTYIITDWHRPCNFSVTNAFKQRLTNKPCDPCQAMLSFTLVNVTLRDLGWYQCYDGATHGTRIERCSVELISKVPTQVHIEPVTPGAVVKAAEGDRLTLTCVVTEALPPVPENGYSWSHLPSTQGQLRPLVGKMNTLTFDPVTRNDSGLYFCQARNDLINGGKTLPGLASVTVDVSYLGQLKTSSDLKVNEGDHVTLTCSVDSKPTAGLAWVVERQEVRHVTANEVHYVLERAACSDSKTYTCRASNPDLPDPEKTASTTLTVNCGQAQASDGNNQWHMTLVALVIIMPTVAVAVIIYYVRRQGRKSSKKFLLYDPDEIRMETQHPWAKESTILTEVFSPATFASPEKSSKATQCSKILDEEGEAGQLLGVEAVEAATTLSQGDTTGMTTRVEHPTEAVEMQAHFVAQGEIDLKEGSARRSQVSTSDTTPRAKKSSEAVPLSVKLDKKEEIDPLLGVEDGKGSLRQSQASTSDMTPRAEKSSKAVQMWV